MGMFRCGYRRRTLLITTVFTALVVCLPVTSLLGWGFQAHREVNGRAVDLLPAPLGDYFQRQRPWLVALSTDADQRRQFLPAEAPNHYIDLEYYDAPPLDSIPRERKAAEKKFGKDNLPKWGTLAWHILGVTRALKDAFEDGEWERAVVLAADLGHYLADAHMPLHTTINYNGKQTGNDGIHHLFETTMIHRHFDDYRPAGLELPIITDPAENVFAWLGESYGYIGALLTADSAGRTGLSEAQLATLTQGYSADPATIPDSYLDRLYEATGPLAWRQLDRSTARLAALWVWAWEQAGSPQPPD